MKWRHKGLTITIFATSTTICGAIHLYCRGYRKHQTLFGAVWAKKNKQFKLRGGYVE